MEGLRAVPGDKSAARVSGWGAAVRAALLAGVVAAIALFGLAADASAFKRVDSFIGSPTGTAGTDGDLFTFPTGVAVNHSGAGGVAPGEIYVVSSNRVQQFSPAGQFVRTWGKDVVKPGAPNDTGTGFEVCDATAPVPNVPTDCKRGEAGALGGEMETAKQVAVDQATGDVYVAENPGGSAEGQRIQKFTASGSFLLAFGWDARQGGVTTFEICTVATNCQRGPDGENAGQFGGFGLGSSNRLAVGPSGDVYLADSENHRLQHFAPTGAFLGAWGWDVIPSGQPGDAGSTYERCPATAANTAGACQAGQPGAALGQFGEDKFIGSVGPVAVAVGADGTVFIADRGNNRVVTADATGSSLALHLDSTDIGTQSGSTTSLSLGSEGHLFVSVRCGDGDAALCPGIGEDSETRVFEFDASGNVVDREHMRGSGLITSGMAVGPGGATFYVASSNHNRLFILDDDGAFPPPAAAVQAVDDLTANSAVLTGTVDPNGPGIRTTYRFEYARQGSDDWIPVQGTALSPPDGSTPQSVTASLVGLEANAAYKARIVAVKEFGASEQVESEPLEFSTPAVPPVVISLQAQGFTDTSAVISGTVNPNNQTTSYFFEWGNNDSYGNQAPLSPGTAAGGVPRYVSEILDELEPDTTYHFRLVAENDEGMSHGADRSFTTRTSFAGFEPRAYEQVSPRRKESDVERGGIILGGGEETPAFPVSADGDHKAFGMWGVLDSADWGGDRISKVLASRTA